VIYNSNEANALRISRLLTPEHRADLLAWVHLAYAAETSVRKSFGLNNSLNEAFPGKPQEYSCKNNAQRSKK
jgi:hypothetical protein